MYNLITLLCTWNIVNQLYFKKYTYFKKWPCPITHQRLLNGDKVPSHQILVMDLQNGMKHSKSNLFLFCLPNFLNLNLFILIRG